MLVFAWSRFWIFFSELPSVLLPSLTLHWSFRLFYSLCPLRQSSLSSCAFSLDLNVGARFLANALFFSSISMFLKARWRVYSSVTSLLSRSSSQKHDSCHKAFLSAYMLVLLVTTIFGSFVLNLLMKERSDSFSFWGIVHISVSEADSWLKLLLVLASNRENQLRTIHVKILTTNWPKLVPHCWSECHPTVKKKEVIWARDLFFHYMEGESWVWCLEWECRLCDQWMVSFVFLLWLCPFLWKICGQIELRCISAWRAKSRLRPPISH